VTPALQAVLKGLAALRLADPHCKLFGARSHRYELHTPATEAEVAAVEAEWEFTLPADHREFLLEAGNGGAGPFYGLFPLGMNDNLSDFVPWRGGGLVNDPAAPFAHTEAWNELPKEDPEEEKELQERFKHIPENQRWLHTMTARKGYQRYWVEAADGAIPICHQGCNLRVWLIVTGQEAGHVWMDDRADGEGLYPATAPGKTRLTFTEWYMAWIEASLRKLKAKTARRRKKR
jgi:hypothetical protein